MRKSMFLLVVCYLLSPFTYARNAQTFQADLIVYGGTSAAISSAVQAVRLGKSVIVVSPDTHLGGLSSGGLGFTDTGNKAVIGGFAREFYQKVYQHYQKPETWKWEKQNEYGNKGQGNPAMDGTERTMWIFEPHVAEMVFEDFVKTYKIKIYRDEWLDRGPSGVVKKNGAIVSFKTLKGNVYKGKMFIDATYEGDLMAAAKVSYHVGREANRVYNEEWNGIQVGILHHKHHFQTNISPYKIPGDPSSGVLPRISTEDPGVRGEEDKKIQAYCYRMCLSSNPDNRIPFAKPADYDPAQYELLARVYATGWKETFKKFDPIPNKKTDTNNHGPFSTDNIGMNYEYPEGSYEKRKAILKEHENYQKGWLYFVANDPSVPEDVRAEMNQYGLPKDEFKDNGNWPHQIYVREARRMVGTHVMTEHEVLGKREVDQPVGMGSYTLDAHNAQRYIKADGFVQNEGDIGVHLKKPYLISYGSIIPKKEDCTNLLVPVCLSSSHIAFGSIRMEPVFMILAQSATTAAVQAIDKKVAIQNIDYQQLKQQMLKDKQILTYSLEKSSSAH
jgi:hypothetical protein